MNRPTAYWVNKPSLDLGLAVAGIGSALVLAHYGLDPLAELDDGSRHDLALGLAATGGALLGFGITAVSVLFAVTPGPRLAPVLAAFGRGLVKLLMSCLGGLAVTTAGFLALIPADSAERASGARFVLVGLAVLGALRAGRLLWLFSRVLRIFAAESSDSAKVAPALSDNWVTPRVSASDYEAPQVRKLPKRKRKAS